MKRAQIVDGIVHWIYDTKDCPDYPEPGQWPPYEDGTFPVIVDLTGRWNIRAREGDGWDSETQRIVPRPAAVYDEDTNEFTLEPPDERDVGHIQNACTIEMVDNFQYGTNYQGKLIDPHMLNDQRVVAGETYMLDVTFMASRTLESEIQVLMVDTSWYGNWWTELTGYTDELARIPAPEAAGEEVTATLILRTIADSVAPDASNIAIVFRTDGDGTEGEAGSGVQGPFEITFSKLILARIDSGSE